jgi:segregation and condensation protein B
VSRRNREKHQNRVPEAQASEAVATEVQTLDVQPVENQAPAETVAPEEVSTEAVSSELMAQLGIEEHQGGAETEDERIRALVEAAVYITDEPLLAAQIAGALGQPVERVQPILDSLVAEYNAPHHGLYVRELAGGYQMATKAEHHEDLRQFVKKLQPPLKLSLAALETLAVIAYKQPVTAPEILEIRGVSGAGVLKTLLDRKLVQISGRKQVLGKPALYKTTKEFLVQFGLKDLSELPTLKEFEELSRLALGDEEAEVEDSNQAEDGEKASEDAADAPAENRDGESIVAVAAAEAANDEVKEEVAEEVVAKVEVES